MAEQANTTPETGKQPAKSKYDLYADFIGSKFDKQSGYWSTEKIGQPTNDALAHDTGKVTNKKD